MAQYDVYPNPTAAQREAFPYFVVLQSDQLAQFSTRLVMPLARAPVPAGVLPRRLSQTVQVAGERLMLAPQLCAALPERATPIGWRHTHICKREMQRSRNDSAEKASRLLELIEEHLPRIWNEGTFCWAVKIAKEFLERTKRRLQ